MTCPRILARVRYRSSCESQRIARASCLRETAIDHRRPLHADLHRHRRRPEEGSDPNAGKNRRRVRNDACRLRRLQPRAGREHHARATRCGCTDVSTSRRIAAATPKTKPVSLRARPASNAPSTSFRAARRSLRFGDHSRTMRRDYLEQFWIVTTQNWDYVNSATRSESFTLPYPA